MIPVVYRYTTGNPGFVNVYSPVGAFDLYGFHDTKSNKVALNFHKTKSAVRERNVSEVRNFAAYAADNSDPSDSM